MAANPAQWFAKVRGYYIVRNVFEFGDIFLKRLFKRVFEMFVWTDEESFK